MCQISNIFRTCYSVVLIVERRTEACSNFFFFFFIPPVPCHLFPHTLYLFYLLFTSLSSLSSHLSCLLHQSKPWFEATLLISATFWKPHRLSQPQFESSLKPHHRPEATPLNFGRWLVVMVG